MSPISPRPLLPLALVASGLALQAAPPAKAAIRRGAYLVQLMGCNDCHTPLKMGPKGPEPDMTRMLSGHPQGGPFGPVPKLEGAWLWAGNATNTAFVGPWGVTFAANLTPDPATGTLDATVEAWIKRVRAGRHLGKGRPVLPPMPIAGLQAATDADLRALYAYLRSIPAIPNKVPDYLEPSKVQ